MSVILVFLLVIMGVAGWWLAQHHVQAWMEQGVPSAFPDTDVTGMFLRAR